MAAIKEGEKNQRKGNEKAKKKISSSRQKHDLTHRSFELVFEFIVKGDL
jgi:hypothetical protein